MLYIDVLQFLGLDVTDAGRTEDEDEDYELSREGSEPLLDDVIVSV